MSASLSQTPLYTLAGGACIGANQYLCALEKNQCADGYDFVSAAEIEAKYQNSPVIECLDAASIVPVGQCTQAKDKGICTGHYSNCEGCFDTKEICFQSNVEKCTFQPVDQANGSLNFATFGLCVNPNELEDRHCLWSRTECPSSYVWVTPNTWITDSMKVNDFCTCDRVQIGACVNGDDFVCAVSPDACSAGEEYIGAKALAERNIDCRLCNEFPIPKDTTLALALPERPVQPAIKKVNRYSTAAGACVNEREYWCALESTQCAEGYAFVSARDLEVQYQNTPAIQCLDQAESVPMGKCTQDRDDDICTGHFSNCEGCFESSDICFQPNVESCALQLKDQGDGSINFATFGLCVHEEKSFTKKHCLWSRYECPQDDVWITPNTWLDDQTTVNDFCTCDRVQIGACRYKDQFICAVSVDSCGADGVYITAKEMIEQAPDTDCRLCKEFALPKKLALQLKRPGMEPIAPKSEGVSGGGIVIMAFGVILTLTILIAVVYKVERKTRGAEEKALVVGLDGELHVPANTSNNDMDTSFGETTRRMSALCSSVISALT